MALGPHSPLSLLTGHIDQLQAVGEIGVMLLLFVVGLDVQPKSLWSMRRLVFGLRDPNPDSINLIDTCQHPR